MKSLLEIATQHLGTGFATASHTLEDRERFATEVMVEIARKFQLYVLEFDQTDDVVRMAERVVQEVLGGRLVPAGIIYQAARRPDRVLAWLHFYPLQPV